MYLLLDKNALIVKRESCCWLLEHVQTIEREIPPLAALMLALCDGTMTRETVIDLAGRTFGTAKDTLDSLLAAQADVLHELDFPLDADAGRYDPTDFVYVPAPIPSQRRGWPDSPKGRLEAPVELLFALTHRCNFRCVYCFNASGEQPCAEDELCTDEWLRIVEQAKEMGVARVTLTGGEPTLHKGFRRIVEALAEANIQPYIATNGYLIDEDMVEWLKQLDINIIQISMDSADEDDFNALVGREGAFKRVIGNVRLLAANGMKVIVKAVLMPDNIEGVPKLVELLEDAGAVKLVLERFDISSCGRGESSMLVTDEMIEGVRKCVRDYRAAHTGLKLLVRTTSNRVCWRDKYDLVSCGAFERSMIILPNGNVSACEKLVDVPEVVAGNVKNQSLAEIWDSPRIREIVYPPDAAYNKACLDCEALHECRAGCYSLKLTLGKGMYDVDPRCFRAEYDGNPFKAQRV